MKMLTYIIAVLSLALLSANVFAANGNKQVADVVGQGPAGPVVSADGATLIRTKNGVTASMKIPTPVPGSYLYPPPNPFQPIAPVPGTPEVFTGWLFFFNNPENCAEPYNCIPPPPGAPSPNDFTEGNGGVYNFAGHAKSGRGSLNLVGHISVGDEQFGGPSVLENPMGAEIHLAIAPHGLLIPALMSEQIRTPVGSPPFWWLALMEAPQ